MSSSSFERFFKRVLVASSLVGVFAIVTVLRVDVASAQSVVIENATPGTSPAEGDINLVFSLATSLTLTITGSTVAPITTITAATSNVNFGAIGITPAGCAAPPSTGECYSIATNIPALESPTQVHLVAALEAEAACSGYSTMGLYIYRATPVAGLVAGRVRFRAGTPGTTTPAAAPTAPVDWTDAAHGAAVQETAAGTANGSLSSALIPSGTGCSTQYVAYHLAARVSSTDAPGNVTTPITHRLFAQ